jgi:four helix bundle protein
MSVIQDLVDKTYQELNEPTEPIQTSRVSSTPNGYIFLISWSNASLLRMLVRKYTSNLPKSEYRLVNQLNDAARSVVANIEEGFARPTTKEYLEFLGFSQASLIEVKGDIQRCLQDRSIKSDKTSNLTKIGIDLNTWHEELKKSVTFKGDYRKLEEFIGKIPVSGLAYEVFIELINKTDWNLRKLVESLERKMTQDKKLRQSNTFL